MWRVSAGTARAWLLALLASLASPASGQETPVAEEELAPKPVAEKPADLRERLTEREDQRRAAEPRTIPLAGRPLTVSGEIELVPGWLRHEIELEGGDESDSVLLEQELEVELFYSFGPRLSLFAQGRLGMELLDRETELFAERGELWLFSENVAGTGVNVDLGRLHFEDDRRWWWDEELDAVRFEYERGNFSTSLAAAYELAPDRTDESFIDPNEQDVLRLIGEGTWDWREGHAAELFLLVVRDDSQRDRAGDRVRAGREDERDARLAWVGGRVMGVGPIRRAGHLGYWLDAAFVWGCERLVEFESASGPHSFATEDTRVDVRGWGLDLGVSWILPLPLEPRLFVGYARGSGDSSPGPDTDRTFRQSGIQTNEAGFGGVERFSQYGVLLDPELANLGVATVGAGLSLLRSSSLDLVYHHYRQAEPATALSGRRFDTELTGTSHQVGSGLDIVLAMEEWERFELELVGAGFRAGQAFGDDAGKWSYGALLALRYAF